MVDSLIFVKIMEKCKEKEIISFCKKMCKDSKLTRSSVAENLCHLAYWLYVYNYTDDVLSVCELSHLEIPKPFDVNYNVWDFILHIWGLEAYIYQKLGIEEEKIKIVEKMNEVMLVPSRKLDTVEKRAEENRVIRENLTFEFATRQDRIERCLKENDEDGVRHYRFIALFIMIGNGVTGLYPHLEEHKEDLETKIDEYIKLIQ